MNVEELKTREEEINRIVNLLCTFGDHDMTEKELLQVSIAYERYYRFLASHIDFKFILNNLFLTASAIDLMSLPQGQSLFRDLIFLSVFGVIDKYLLGQLLHERKDFTEERNWIKRFKETKNREPDATRKLIQKMGDYQTELIEIKEQLCSLEEKKKIYK